MLTTDMCLVYNSNKVYDKCSRLYVKVDDKVQFLMRLMECMANDFDTYGDLDPAVEPPCCAWIISEHARIDGESDFLSGEYEFCGDTIQQGRYAGSTTCCAHAGGPCNNCDNNGFPQGIAYTQVVDFANDESLWLKYFLIAWHRATENGLDLSYLNLDEGPIREYPDEEESFDCSPYTREHQCLEQKAHCKWVSMGFFKYFYSR